MIYELLAVRVTYQWYQF